MKRFWKLSVAMVLGLVSISPVVAQQQAGGQKNAAQPNVRQRQQPGPGMPGIPNAIGAPYRVPLAQQQAQGRVQQQPGPGMPGIPNAVGAPYRVPLAQQQAQAQQQQSNPANGGVLQAQGVNRNPGQQGLGQGQQPQNQQFLGTNRPAAAPIQPQNQLDEFGANVNQANAVIAAENQQRQALTSSNSIQDGNQANGQEQLYASSGFVPANLSSGYGIAGSLEEGILSGQARFMQGSGEYNRNSAEALKTTEQARALALENARTRLKTYFELKDLNEKYRSSRAPMPISKEKLDEWNRDDQPERLTRREYNSDSGRVQWPSCLMTAAFDDYRMEVDALFARRTANEYGVSSDFYRNVHQDTAKMQAILKAYLRSEERFFTDQEYIVAKNFLNSLAHEARLAPDLDGLAAN